MPRGNIPVELAEYVLNSTYHPLEGLVRCIGEDGYPELDFERTGGNKRRDVKLSGIITDVYNQDFFFGIETYSLYS